MHEKIASEKIAIIGGGIAGLTAAYLLHKKYDIQLYESRGCLGGNAHAHKTHTGEEFDTGVAAFSKEGYPNFFKLMAQLNVNTRPTRNFAFTLQDLDTKKGVYITPNVKGLVAQKFALLKPSTVRSYLKFLKGLKRCIEQNKRGELEGVSFEELLQQTPEFYGDGKLLLVTGLCLMTSMHGDQLMAAPAEFLIRKLTIMNDYLTPKHLSSIRLLDNSTREYVDLMSQGYRDKIVLNAEIAKIERHEDGAALLFKDGQKKAFDKVILACNADKSLELLADPTELERQLLSPWKYNTSHMVVHEDHQYYPQKELMGGFVCLYRHQGKFIETSVSGTAWVHSKPLAHTNYLVTQYANFPIKDQLIDGEVSLRTPIFDTAAVKTIKRLPELNGIKHTYFCGSHFGHGLHEDAIRSAIDASRLLGASF